MNDPSEPRKPSRDDPKHQLGTDFMDCTEPGDADQAIRNAVESAFGPGAFDLLNDADTMSDPALGDTALATTEGLDQLVAEIDSGIGERADHGSASQGSSLRSVSGTSDEKHIVFALNDSLYAVQIKNVLEILQLPSITSIPNVPEWVLGVSNLRGEIISVVELSTLLGMNTAKPHDMRWAMVVQSLQEDVTTGLMVDSVVGIRNLPADKVGDPTAPVGDKASPYLLGVTESEGVLVAVLDMEGLLYSDEMQRFNTEVSS